jgi:hypothetical protein
MAKKVVDVADGKPTGKIVFYYDDHVAAVPASADGKTPAVDGVDSFDVFDVSKVPGYGDLPESFLATTVGRLALHGASQKIGDASAGAVNASKELGISALDYAKQATRETIAQLYAGTWRTNAGGGPRVNELAIAISRATGEPLDGDEGTVALVAAMDDATVKAWKKKPKVALELQKIALEKAQKKLEEAQKAAEAEEAKAPAAA